jgi:hypothetical protein
MRMGKARVYRIVVGSEVGDRYASAFEGMSIETREGQTILTGEVEDQAHLFGILRRLNGMGLDLLSVEALSLDDRPVAEGIESRSHDPGS